MSINDDIIAARAIVAAGGSWESALLRLTSAFSAATGYHPDATAAVIDVVFAAREDMRKDYGRAIDRAFFGGRAS